MNIVQEDNSNISEFLKNLWLNNLQFIILKFCRFCLFVTFVFILLLLYTQMFLILSFSWLEKKRKKQFKSQPRPPLTIKIFTFVQPCLLFQTPPPPLIRLLVFDIFPKPLRFHIPHILETREYKGNKDFQNLSNKEIYFTLQSNSAKWYKKFSNSFRGQKSLKDTIFSVKKALMDIYWYMFCLVYTYSFFSSFKPWKILCPRCSEQEESQPLLQALHNYSRLHQWTNQFELLFWYPLQNYSRNHQGTPSQFLYGI